MTSGNGVTSNPNLVSTEESGQDRGAKSDKQLEKELKKQAKLEKFKAKSSSVNSSAGSAKKLQSNNVASAFQYKENTKPGEMKDLSEFPKSYSPKFVEACWYSWWQAQGFFRPDCHKQVSSKKSEVPFVMIFPPPNVTGTLHLGHALTCTIQDCLARYRRMRGYPVLWVPGSDHAGIATQVVVEKRLLRDEGKSRFDLGRNKFVEKVWEWKKSNGDRIYEQIKLLGASCDWDQAVFTMDEMHSNAVTEAFIRLYEKKQIYRASRVVNWSVSLQSVISDIEVEKTPISGKTWLTVPGYDKRILFGYLTTFVYRIVGGGEIPVATTRLETMLGDVAISVHPDDKRYQKYHGMRAQHPFFPDREILVVTDEDVDMEYGTGAVKISPGHDFHDFEVSERYQLPVLSCIDETGHIAAGFGEFTGMRRFDARGHVASELEKRGLLVGTTEVSMVLPICSRSKDIIEPLVKPQWFVRMHEDAMRALEMVERGEVDVLPFRYVRDCERWLSNCRDWCVSRQLWWGHRIPAYKVIEEGKTTGWVVAASAEEAGVKARQVYSTLSNSATIEQDSDVLDTWFSSSLLPFSAFGWPCETENLKRFYPGTLLETGHDILFFWVIRMIVMSLKLNNLIPFTQVYLHGLIRDSHGRKMSKSLGNIIDPMDVVNGIALEDLHANLSKYNLTAKEIETAKLGQRADFPNGIPECGTDALRFAFLTYCSQTCDINLDILRIKGYRHFCNKLWQAFRFAIEFALPTVDRPLPLTCVNWANSLPSSWILSRLAHATEESTVTLERYDFARYATAVYNFWLYELCDVFIELIKPHLRDSAADNCGIDERLTLVSVLAHCLDAGLRLLHPAMPFITEELYQRLPHNAGFHPEKQPSGHDQRPSIMVSPFPDFTEMKMFPNGEVEVLMQTAQECVTTIRRLNPQFKDKPRVIIVCRDKRSMALMAKCLDVVRDLTNCQSVEAKLATSEAEMDSFEAVNYDYSVMVTPFLSPANELADFTERL